MQAGTQAFPYIEEEFCVSLRKTFLIYMYMGIGFKIALYCTHPLGDIKGVIWYAGS